MRTLLVLATFWLGAATALAADTVPFDATPAGITPTTMTLKGLFAMSKLAQGNAPKTRIEKWALTAEELTGTQTIYTSGTDTREDDVLGPFQSASGRLGAQKWRQNENGLTLRLRGIHMESEINSRALRNPAKFGRAVRILGETAVPSAAYVVELNVPGGRKEWLFFDKTTKLIVRTETVWQEQRVTTTLDDFRKTRGVTEAWHVHVTDGRPFNDEDYKLQSLEFGMPVDPSHFAIPPNRHAMFDVPGGKAAVPATIIDDMVVVAMKVNGHSENFQLDSGASGILIDRDVALKDGLKTYGRSTGATAGSYVQTRTVIPEATIGDLTLHDLVVESLPFETAAGSKRVVGLLGFDFIAGAVIHIDYLNGKLEAIDPKSFAPPPGAHEIPIALDDGVPFVAASIASTRAEHFILDTGAFRSTLFSAFAKSNPAAVADQGLGDSLEASFPFVNHLGGVGGTINVRPTQVKDFAFAGFTFAQWLFLASQENRSFEGEDADGLIGQDFLRNFDVYLDYSRERIYLVPNDRYNARWPKR